MGLMKVRLVWVGLACMVRVLLCIIVHVVSEVPGLATSVQRFSSGLPVSPPFSAGYPKLQYMSIRAVKGTFNGRRPQAHLTREETTSNRGLTGVAECGGRCHRSIMGLLSVVGVGLVATPAGI